jgi:predicted DCC family thiol-disulfide oxidoreductase YuxK
MHVSIVYDGKCPICRRVATGARVYQRTANLELIDARSGNLEDIQARDLRGLDFDEGFAVVVAGGVYHEAEAARVLAVLTKPRGVGYRLFRWLMRTESRSQYWYPVLKSARRRLLFLMRVPPINQSAEGEACGALPTESN